jgi:AraC-like DNA-binding protein
LHSSSVPSACSASAPLSRRASAAPAHGATQTRQDRALVAATLTRAVVVAASGEVDVIGVRFHPGRAYPFLAAAPAELVDSVAPALDVVARELTHLPARLEPGATPALFATVETVLLERLARAGSDRRYDRLVEALIAPEAPSVASLAGAAAISQRQFERLFKSRAGVSAKRLQRVVRFHRLAAGLLDGSLDLAALALDAGFYDQAHMSREFRSLAQVTPARYAQRAGALDRLFAES